MQQNSASQFTILGGDGLIDIVNPNHNTFVTTYATVYAMPLKKDNQSGMQLVEEYKQQKFPVPYLASAIPGYTLLPQGVIRSYNAMKAFTSTLEDLAGRNLDTTQENINNLLAPVSFDGIDGRIGFQGDAINSRVISDPQDTVVYIMCTGRNNTIGLVATYNGNSFVPEQGACPSP